MSQRQTHHRRVITAGAGLLALLLLSTCNKIDTKDDIVYTVTATMPHDGTPVPGVKVNIVEYKEKKGKLEETGWVRQDVTDATGRAWGRFMGKRKANYTYHIFFDYSGMQLPVGIDDVAVKGPQFTPLTRYQGGKSNNFDIRVLPHMPVQINFKNTACIDENDIFRYKSVNIDELPHFIFHDGIPWLEGPSLNGCVNIQGDYLNRLAGHYVFKWEAVRGGVLTTDIDTFYVAPGGNDQIQMEW